MVSDYLSYKIACKKSFFLGNFFTFLSRIFLVSVFFTPFNGLFAPTSQSPMSKLFILLNLWGKVWHKVVSDLQTFAHKGYKIAAAKKFFFTVFFLYMFTPKSNVPTFQIFRILGGERKKIVSYLKTFPYKGCKIAATFFLAVFCLISKIFCIGATNSIG